MEKITVVFFGSFQNYSALVLQGLLNSKALEIAGVVTTPAFINSTKNEVKNPVQELAEFKGLPVFTPDVLNADSLAEIEAKVGKTELIVTAGYGKLLPETWLSWPSLAALNLHFSLLPKYRGANPAEWAILCGESQTGVTLIEMSPEFDTGKIVAAAAAPILSTDTREAVYQKLYTLGGEVLPAMLEAYVAFAANGTAPKSDGKITYSLPPTAQPESSTPYAGRFTRDDGFIDWTAISAAIDGESSEPEMASSKLQSVLSFSNQKLDSIFIERAIRALKGFPGAWTKIPTAKGEKRMKLLSAQAPNGRLDLDQVQIEGKPVTRWAESKNIVIWQKH